MVKRDEAVGVMVLGMDIVVGDRSGWEVRENLTFYS